MTSSEAVDILSNSLGKIYGEEVASSFEMEVVGKIKETFDDHDFPNSFLINAMLTNKKGIEEAPFAVSKSTGECRIAMLWG